MVSYWCAAGAPVLDASLATLGSHDIVNSGNDWCAFLGRAHATGQLSELLPREFFHCSEVMRGHDARINLAKKIPWQSLK